MLPTYCTDGVHITEFPSCLAADPHGLAIVALGFMVVVAAITLILALKEF